MLFGNKKVSSYSPKNYSQNKAGKVKGKWWEQIGSATDIAGIIIGTVIGGFTIALFFQTKDATKAATDSANASVRSADAAEKTFREQKSNDSILRFADSTKYSNDTAAQNRRDKEATAEAKMNNIESERRFQKQITLQQQTTNAQIKAFNEQQKEFNAEHEPYLEVDSLYIERFQPGKTVLVSYYIKNITNQPIKRDSSEVEMVFVPKNLVNTVVANPLKWVTWKGTRPDNSYITLQKPGSTIIYFDNNNGQSISQETFDDVMSGDLLVFVYGKLFYYSLRNGDRKRYDFVVQPIMERKRIDDIPYFGATGITMIYNENTKIN